MTEKPFAFWRATDGEARFSDPAACAERASAFERTIRRRNVIEYGAGGVVIAGFAGFAGFAVMIGQPVLAIGSAMIVAATVLVMRHLARRGSFGAANPAQSCVLFLRDELTRQRDLLRAVPRWYLAPFLPGMAVFFGGIAHAVAREAGWSFALMGLAKPLAGAVVIFGAVALLNHLAARRLTREIAELDALA